MRIEISAGGIGSISVSDFHADMQTHIKNAESVISSFKAVNNKVHNLSGGVGSLQEAADDISSRIQLEEQKREAAAVVQKKSNDFLELALRVDRQVASLVNQNKDELYRVNPWLKPRTSTESTPWYEDAWNWLCGKGEQIAEGLKTAWDWTKDTAKKAWDGLVEFYNEHKKAVATILMIVGAITALIVLSLVPGGGILATIIAGAAWGTISGAVIGGVAGGLESMAAGGSFWEGAETAHFPVQSGAPFPVPLLQVSVPPGRPSGKQFPV